MKTRYSKPNRERQTQNRFGELHTVQLYRASYSFEWARSTLIIYIGDLGMCTFGRYDRQLIVTSFSGHMRGWDMSSISVVISQNSRIFSTTARTRCSIFSSRRSKKTACAKMALQCTCIYIKLEDFLVRFEAFISIMSILFLKSAV